MFYWSGFWESYEVEFCVTNIVFYFLKVTKRYSRYFDAVWKHLEVVLSYMPYKTFPKESVSRCWRFCISFLRRNIMAKCWIATTINLLCSEEASWIYFENISWRYFWQRGNSVSVPPSRWQTFKCQKDIFKGTRRLQLNLFCDKLPRFSFVLQDRWVNL